MFLLVLQAASQLKLLDPVAPSLDSKGSTCSPDSVDVKKIGTGKSKTFKPASFDQVHMIKHKRQSNSIKFTRFFRSMTVRDFSPFLPPPVAAVPSQEAFLYQTEEPKKNQQSGRSTDCGGQGKIFSQNKRTNIYNYIYIEYASTTMASASAMLGC